MLSLGKQIEQSAQIIQACIDHVGENPPEYTDWGAPLRDLSAPVRYASFSEAILNLDSVYFLHLTNKYPEADFDKIIGAHETGIDVAANFIRIGSVLMRKYKPEATPQDAAEVLKRSAGQVIAPLMNTSIHAAASVELAHGLQSSTASSSNLEKLEYQDGIITFGNHAQGVLERGQGRCPYARFMPQTFDSMVAAALEINWLLPQDFEKIEAEV